MKRRRVTVFLTDPTNEYQQLQQADALDAAARCDVEVQIHFSGKEITQQIQQVYACLNGQLGEKPDAILLQPSHDGVLSRMPEHITRNGIGLVILNRTPALLEELRRSRPGIPISAVSPDQREIGRIQGRQFQRLLPAGGVLLYVLGSSATAPAQERLEGMREIPNDSRIEVSTVDGDFREERAEAAVAAWLRVVLPGGIQVALIGCQNDAMALGARLALESLAAKMNRPDLLRIPLTGCDGLPQVGLRLVKEGRLAATVIVPSTTGAAVSLVDQALSSQAPPPAQVLLAPKPYPELHHLQPA